ncbi:MAG: dihydroorotate dehydrogenase electron transfer subunit, partial [Candidatus Neomarinimicrobiota bacterium]
ILDLLGPLGIGFYLEGSFSHALVVAGGMGSAPIFFLIDKLLELKKRITFFWGVKNKNEIFALKDLRNSGVDVRIITEDGSMGRKGLITDILKPFLAEHREDRSLEGFVCGPVKMLKQVQGMAEITTFGWQVSLEERMACGVGVCMGCGVKMKEGGYKMVCSDGPVFNLREILFDD